MSDKKHALSVLTGVKIAPGANLTAAGKALNEQLRLIRNADTEFAMRAVYVGTALLMVKESLAHGEFGPWLQKNIDDLGRRQVAYYMKLALAALDHTKVDQKALAALPVGDIESALTLSKGPGADFKAAVEKFVGDSSLADLLAEHCGKTKGGAKKKSGGSDDQDDAGEASEAKAELTVQDRFNEIETSLRAAVRGATDKGTWMAFDRAQHDALKAAFTDAANQVDAIFLKTHGRNARK